MERYSTLNRTFAATLFLLNVFTALKGTIFIFYWIHTVCWRRMQACYDQHMWYCLGNFMRILPILTSKHVSHRTRGKVFNACVHSALLHGSETWAPTAPDLQRLHRNDRSMVRCICGVRDDDEVPAYTLCAMLGMQEVNAALRTRRMRLFGHVARTSSCTNSITSMTIPSTRKRGRPKQTWSVCVKADMKMCSLGSIDQLNR